LEHGDRVCVPLFCRFVALPFAAGLRPAGLVAPVFFFGSLWDTPPKRFFFYSWLVTSAAPLCFSSPAPPPLLAPARSLFIFLFFLVFLSPPFFSGSPCYYSGGHSLSAHGPRFVLRPSLKVAVPFSFFLRPRFFDAGSLFQNPVVFFFPVPFRLFEKPFLPPLIVPGVFFTFPLSPPPFLDFFFFGQFEVPLARMGPSFFFLCPRCSVKLPPSSCFYVLVDRALSALASPATPFLSCMVIGRAFPNFPLRPFSRAGSFPTVAGCLPTVPRRPFCFRFSFRSLSFFFGFGFPSPFGLGPFFLSDSLHSFPFLFYFFFFIDLFLCGHSFPPQEAVPFFSPVRGSPFVWFSGLAFY